MKTLEIFITIHATSEWNEWGQCQGHCDSKLSEAGTKMANLMANRPDLQNIKAIYTSDLKRAHDTALPLARRLGIPIETTPLLREGNWPDHHEDPEYPPLPFDGPYEDKDSLTRRASECMAGIAEAESRSPILIVTHGGFLNFFIGYSFPERSEEYKGIRTALNHLRYSNTGWELLGVNDDSHLNAEASSKATLDCG